MRISDWSSDVCSSDLRMGKAFDIGLRINPEHREGEVEKYDPCQSHSRLGHPISQLRASDLEGVSGLHFHTLCEQDFLPLDRTWAAVEPLIRPFLGQIKWLNFGGGHHITRADYQRDDLVLFLKRILETTDRKSVVQGQSVSVRVHLGGRRNVQK